MGQACCGGDTCNSGLGCTNAFMGGGTCDVCGGSGQACCFTSGMMFPTCSSGFTCTFGMGMNLTCAACGAKGQPCCTAGFGMMGTCDMGLTCTGGMGGFGGTCN
jgi:hypothetical protein